MGVAIRMDKRLREKLNDEAHRQRVSVNELLVMAIKDLTDGDGVYWGRKKVNRAAGQSSAQM